MAGTHGGRRAGAGRKAGIKQPTQALRVQARAKLSKLVASDADPLDFVCNLACDPKQALDVRLEAARIALPFLHPKLSALASVHTNVPASADPHATLEKLMGNVSRLAPPMTIEATADRVAEAVP